MHGRIRSQRAPKVNLESTSPHDGLDDPASHICGYTDGSTEVSILTQPTRGMHTTGSACAPLRRRKYRQTHSCGSCAEQQRNEDSSTERLKSKRRALQSTVFDQRAAVRRAKSVPALKDGFARALWRVQRGKGDGRNSRSCTSTREAKITAWDGTVDQDVYERALRVAGELVDIQRQPRFFGPRSRSVLLVAQPRGGALRNTNYASDLNTHDFQETNGRVEEICERGAETSQQRHRAEAWQQARKHSARTSAQTLKKNGFAGSHAVSNADASICLFISMRPRWRTPSLLTKTLRLSSQRPTTEQRR